MKLFYMREFSCGKHTAENAEIFGKFVTFILMIFRVKIQKSK